ncbi:MAG: C25 family cysteine peptidase [Limnohabitans sp.]|nr:C25 family cysteine peptidase [Limnohabitans sp.]
MKIKLLQIFLFFSVVSIFAQQDKKIINLNSKNSFEISNMTNNGFDLELNLSQIELKKINTPQGDFVDLSQESLSHIYDVGRPNIPILTKLIEIPQEAKVEFEVVSYQEKLIDLSYEGFLNKIVPARESLSKSKAAPAYIMDRDVYSQDRFDVTSLVNYKHAGQMRDVSIGNLEIAPIQYNAVQNKLRVLNNLKVRVKFIGADHAKTQSIKKKYGQSFDNNGLQFFNKLSYNTRELITQSPTHLVIVSSSMFQSQLAPFIAWKIKKGFKVTVGYTNVIGTTKEAIKAYLKNIYTGSTPMSYVLFVGDVGQVPSWTGTSQTDHVTDLRYCEYTNDDLPEVYYGRFSANTTAELQPQIDKTLTYERYTFSDPAFLREAVILAGDDASMEMVWGNGQVYYGEQNYFKAGNNVNATTYYQPLDNDAVSAAIISKVNSGLGFANYSAHCSSDGWASPGFSRADLAGLQNNGKFGVWIGNCCQSNKFEEQGCFGENALRKVNSGAVGYIGGSNLSYWDEDYWWAVGNTANIVAQPTYATTDRGAFDAYWHTMANEVNNTASWYISQSQMIRSGNIAVQASTSSLKQYYWEIYHLMGDPTLIPFIGTPQVNSVSTSPTSLATSSTTLQINAMPYSQVAISQNGVLIASGFTSSAGTVTLTLASGALAVGTADLVVTGQNRIPVITTINVTALGVNDFDYALSVYPNPTTSEINIVFTNDVLDKNAKVQVYNVIGQLVLDQNLNSNKTTLNLNESEGVYFMKITSGNQTLTRKIVLKK